MGLSVAVFLEGYEPMQLRIIGYWAPYPRALEACSGYLVSSDSAHLLLDCGHGVCSRLARWLPAEQLDALIITHFHPDHYVDLFAIRHSIGGALRAGSRSEPLPVYMPDQPKHHYQAFAQMKELQVIPLTDQGNYTVGDMQFQALAVTHPMPTFGIKVSYQNRSLFYTADTSYDQQVVAAARGAKLLLCECSLRIADGEFARQLGHMTTAQAGQLARKSGAEILVATHFWPEYHPEALQQEIQPEYQGRIIMAASDLTVQI